MAHDEPLRSELVSERLRDGTTLWRSEIRDTDGRMVDLTSLTPHPRQAIADGQDLLGVCRELPDYLPAYRDAQRLFAHVA